MEWKVSVYIVWNRQEEENGINIESRGSGGSMWVIRFNAWRVGFNFVMTMMSLTLDEMLESFLFTTLRSIFEPYTFG